MESSGPESDGQREPYVFQGLVLPEHAQLSLAVHFGLTHLASGAACTLKVSIILNQITVWVHSDVDWDIFDLRNLVRTALQNNIAMLGYLKGLAYDIQLTRVLNQSRAVDYVFGVDTPCIAERNKAVDISAQLASLQAKTVGANGVLLNRCFGDLASALKHADDTGFYCYRAIEALVHHCSATNELTSAAKSNQWKKFQDVSGASEQVCREIQDAARPLRHGEASDISSADRAALLLKTWSVVDGYIDSLPIAALNGQPTD